MSWCGNSGWYEYHYHGEDTFASLIPKNLIACKEQHPFDLLPADGKHGSPDHEKIILATVTMLLGLLFLLMIAVRSCNRTKMDWYRLIAFYILATLGVPLSLNLGPQPNVGGFNRIIGFGILIHNLGEVHMLGHIWFGSVNQKGKDEKHNTFGGLCAIMYVWVLFVCIVWLPPVPLFFVLMTQGAFCDWSLVATFLYLGWYMDKTGPRHDHKWNCFGYLGIAAALTHILSIQPLFFGIALTSFTLKGITVGLLMPTFILYVWFAAADKAKRPFILQPSEHSTAALDEDRNNLLIKLIGSEADESVKAKSVELEDLNYAGYAAAAKKEIGKKAKAFTYDEMIGTGLWYYKGKDKFPNQVWGKVVAAFGITMAVGNSTLVLFSPCMIDMKAMVC